MAYRGTYKNGVVTLDEPAPLSDGQRVTIELEATESTATQRLLKLAGNFADSPADASVDHDHYLYGAPKRKPE